MLNKPNVEAPSESSSHSNDQGESFSGQSQPRFLMENYAEVDVSDDKISIDDDRVSEAMLNDFEDEQVE
jgi:hypothetical protein